MDRSHVAQLIAVTCKQDAIAQQVKAETAREVFCHVASVSAAEFFDAGRSGLRAALKITVFDADYHCESIAVVRLLEHQMPGMPHKNGCDCAR